MEITIGPTGNEKGDRMSVTVSMYGNDTTAMEMLRLFVAAMKASSYTEETIKKALEDWTTDDLYL